MGEEEDAAEAEAVLLGTHAIVNDDPNLPPHLDKTACGRTVPFGTALSAMSFLATCPECLRALGRAP